MDAPSLYAEELSCLGHGLPVWDPQPTGAGGAQIGDVGYMLDGCFFRLFNAISPADHPYNRNGVPKDFTPFRYDPALLHICDPYLHAGIHSGRNVSIERLALATSGDSQDASEHCVATVEGDGALLVLADGAKREVIVPNQALDEYFQRHHQQWFMYASDVCEISCKSDDIVLVRGWVKTRRTWAVASWQLGAERSALDIATSSAGVVMHGCPPRPEIEIKSAPRRAVRGTSTSSTPPASPFEQPKPPDQCIFLIALRRAQSHAPSPSETYARAMASLGRGVPLWHPDRVSRRRHGVQIGDVGLVHGGAFFSLFNVTVDAGHPWNAHGVPPSFASCRSREAARWQTSCLDSGVYASGAVSVSVGSLEGESTPIAPSRRYDVHCGRDGGAVLFLLRAAKSTVLDPSQIFQEYALKNRFAWHKFILERFGVPCALEDMVLVRGFVKAPQWTVATFVSHGIDGDVDGAFIAPREGRLLWSEGRRRDMSVGYRSSEPLDAEDARNDLPAPDDAFDQCVFLIKYDFEEQDLPPDRVESEFQHFSDSRDSSLRAPVASRATNVARTLDPVALDSNGTFTTVKPILRTESPTAYVDLDHVNSFQGMDDPARSQHRSRDIWIKHIIEAILFPKKRYRHDAGPGRRTEDPQSDSSLCVEDGESAKANVGRSVRQNTTAGIDDSASVDAKVAGLLELALRHDRPYDCVVNLSADPGVAHGSNLGETVLEKTQEILDVMRRARPKFDRRDVAVIKQRTSLRRVLLKLCKDLGSVPSSLFLSGVACSNRESPSAGGSFADIFRATHGGCEVALKRLRVFSNEYNADDNRMSASFYQEAVMWRQLEHPNILPFLGLEQDIFAGMLSMVSPWMPRGNISDCLRSLKKDSKAIPSQLWAHEIASGLRYLHSECVVHGDLRGANILVDQNYHVHIADFGLSVLIDMTRTMSTAGEMTHRSGACRWMAPEILMGSKPTYAADVYSFGCVCLEICEGKAPFAHLLRDHQVITAKIAAGLLPEWPEITDGTRAEAKLRSIIIPCWGSEAASRPSMDALETMLAALMTG